VRINAGFLVENISTPFYGFDQVELARVIFLGFCIRSSVRVRRQGKACSRRRE